MYVLIIIKNNEHWIEHIIILKGILIIILEGTVEKEDRRGTKWLKWKRLMVDGIKRGACKKNSTQA